MTQKTKLEIIGPYTPEHEGPFCTRDGKCVRIVTLKDGSEKFPIIGFLCGLNCPIVWDTNGKFYGSKNEHEKDLMNAREVPVAREFWVNEYAGGTLVVYDAPEKAQEFQVCLKRTIHVREVLPGEGA